MQSGIMPIVSELDIRGGRRPSDRTGRREPVVTRSHERPSLGCGDISHRRNGLAAANGIIR
jgi:hypothetical protein